MVHAELHDAIDTFGARYTFVQLKDRFVTSIGIKTRFEAKPGESWQSSATLPICSERILTRS